MKRTLTALTIAATMFASSASAFDPADLQKLMHTGDCVQCNLKGADLFLVDLRGAYLGVANLFYALMNGTSLCNTIMPNGSMIDSGC